MKTAMYINALKLYDYMDVHKDSDGIYKDTKTKAFRATMISQTYYTPLFKALEEMGSIESLVIGGRGKRIHIRMISRPTEDAFAEAWRVVALTLTDKDDKLRQEIRDLHRRLPDVDLMKILKNFEERLQALERKA